MTRPTLLRRASSGLNSLPIRTTAAAVSPAVPSMVRAATFQSSLPFTPEHRMEVIKSSLLMLKGTQPSGQKILLKPLRNARTQTTQAVENQEIPKTPYRRLLASDIFKREPEVNPTSVEALPREFHSESQYHSQTSSLPIVGSMYSYRRPQAPEDLLGPLAKSPLSPSGYSQAPLSSRRRFQSPTEAFIPPSLVQKESSAYNYINPNHNSLLPRAKH